MFHRNGSQQRSTGRTVYCLLVALITLLLPCVALPQAAPKTPFRLGTAGLPFAWSTAIADFDSDHQPDFAIANKIGTSARGYEYSLEFALSVEPPQVFRFHSSYSGLSVAAVDLDNDNDLDVVLTRITNGEVVVWINDGHGQFSEGRKESAFSVRLSLSRTPPGQRSSEPVLISTNFRRSVATPAATRFRWIPRSEAKGTATPTDNRAGSANSRPSSSPRAPPLSAVV